MLLDRPSITTAILLISSALLLSSIWTMGRNEKPDGGYVAENRNIVVDGSFDDWNGIPFIEMNEEEFLFVWDEGLSKDRTAILVMKYTGHHGVLRMYGSMQYDLIGQSQHYRSIKKFLTVSLH